MDLSGRDSALASGWANLLDLGTTIALAVVLAYFVAITVIGVRRRTMHEPDSGDFDGLNDGADAAAVPGWASRSRRGVFVVLALGSALLLWAVALVLSDDSKRFLAAREWQAQPLYLAAHLIALRLFASIFAHNYLEGVQRLKQPEAEARLAVATLLGPLALLAAMLIAMPFCLSDLRHFLGTYEKLSGSVTPSAVDWLMYAIWCLEWTINALIWVILCGALVLNVRSIRGHDFRAPIYDVLVERHYRPFLRMGVQGASVTLAFGVATLLYILHAGGELTDYLGLGITVGLLAASFVPPWLALRRKVNAAVTREMSTLQMRVRDAGAIDADASLPSLAEIDTRQRNMQALLRLLHLDRLHQNVGQREATAVLLRLLAPAMTIGWSVWSNGAMMQKMLEILKRMLG